MLSVIKTDNLPELLSDGVIGLGPPSQRASSSNFIEELYKAGIISQKIFSLQLTKRESNLPSKLTFGKINLPKNTLESDIAWISNKNPYYWSVDLQ